MNPSIYEMLAALDKLRSYADLSEWEDSFIENVVGYVNRSNGDTTVLTGKQVDKIEQLYERHIGRPH